MGKPTKEYSNNELHLHSDSYYNGGGDGVMTFDEIVRTAIERGAKAVALTDHGNCANLINFYLYCTGQEADHKRLPEGYDPIKPIMGVEAYIRTNNFYGDVGIDKLEEKEITQHLVILCKDYQGFQAMSRFVSECNRNLDSKGRPVGTEEMLRQFFGPGSEGYGHVVCSSACIGGVLATPLSYNDKVEKEIGKIERRIQNSLDRIPKAFFDAEEIISDVNRKIALIGEEIDKLTPVANKKYKDAKAAIKQEPNQQIKEALQSSLDIEIAETKLAKDKITDLKAERKRLKDTVPKDVRETFNKHKDKLKTIGNNRETINALRLHMKSDAELIADATDTAKRYIDIFGKEDFYGEIQYHGIEEEVRYFSGIIQICQDLGIEMIATNDVHIATPDDVKKRELMMNIKRLGKGEYQFASDFDKELYYKTGAEKFEYLTQVFPEDVVDKAMKNIEVVCEKCNFELPITKKLKPKVIEKTDDISDVEYDLRVQEEYDRIELLNAQIPKNLHYPEYRDAIKHLRELAETGHTEGVTTLDGSITFDISYKSGGIQNRYGDQWNEDYQKRLDYELDVIDKMGYASYFLYIADVICACKSQPGFNIGPGRGSGAGSIACYNSGITELDPIKYGLMFERFLNPERVSMPKMCQQIGHSM